MVPDIEKIQDDLRSFADDENDLIIEKSGEVLFNRFGKELQCKINKGSNGSLLVSIDGQYLPYLKFISKELARLDLFAEKLIHRYPSPPNFVNGPAILDSPSDKQIKNKSLELLNQVINDTLPFTSRVVFITADAGQGKTMLLKEMQYKIAKRYLSNQCQYLFWHVDLQGRQLLRLNEALLGDLGELRITGLYMQSIITLIRYGLIVLAIDGFDELAAEQGNSDALGALSHLVNQMNDSGTIVAASRRTFFDAEEYIKRTKILSISVSPNSQFDQLKLCDWTKQEDLEYLGIISIDGKKFQNPEKIYNEILHELKADPEHPMLTRPFLLAQIAKGLLLYDLSPGQFIGNMKNPLESVASVLEAFIDREVTQKWKNRETGEPYLSQDQHIALLNSVAEEMWQSQQDKIRYEFIEEILSVLMDEWKIEHNRRPSIIEMVKMHVLLIAPDSDYTCRKFEHPEFKNYFISYSLQNIIKTLGEGVILDSALRFLAIAQLPDSVAKYAASKLPKQPDFVKSILMCLDKMINNEWRPTFLQANVGTIIPYLINNVDFNETLIFAQKVVYSSIVFENSKIRNVRLQNGYFVNNFFNRVDWEGVTFEDCEFNDPIFDRTNSRFKNVIFINCKITTVTLCEGGDEVRKEYSPSRIIDALKSINIGFHHSEIMEQTKDDPFDHSEQKNILMKLINIFRKTTRVTSNILKIKFSSEHHSYLFETLIPLAEKYGILVETKWKGGGNAKSWRLTTQAEDILKYQDCNDNSEISCFWKQIKKTAK